MHQLSRPLEIVTGKRGVSGRSGACQLHEVHHQFEVDHPALRALHIQQSHFPMFLDKTQAPVDDSLRKDSRVPGNSQHSGNRLFGPFGERTGRGNHPGTGQCEEIPLIGVVLPEAVEALETAGPGTACSRRHEIEPDVEQRAGICRDRQRRHQALDKSDDPGLRAQWPWTVGMEVWSIVVVDDRQVENRTKLWFARAVSSRRDDGDRASRQTAVAHLKEFGDAHEKLADNDITQIRETL